MKIIKYFNNEMSKDKKQKVKEKRKEMIYDKMEHKMVEIEKEIEVEKPIYELKQLKYPVNDKECEKWYNIIKKTYGEYGDVTIQEGGEDEKPLEELQAEINAQLLKDSANLQIQLKKQQELNATLLIKIAQLGGNVNA